MRNCECIYNLSVHSVTSFESYIQKECENLQLISIYKSLCASLLLSTTEKKIHFPSLKGMMLPKMLLILSKTSAASQILWELEFEEMATAAFFILNLALATARALTAALSFCSRTRWGQWLSLRIQTAWKLRKSLEWMPHSPSTLFYRSWCCIFAKI